MSTERTQEVSCRDCENMITVRQHLLLGRWLGPHLCLNCVSARASQQGCDTRNEREARWLQLCPPLYRECASDKLPSGNAREALKTALSWKPSSGLGLGVVGRNSGQGKTRILFAAARPHFLAGTSFKAVNCGALGIEISASIGGDLRELLRPLKGVGLLLLDDLGKERATPHVATALYNIIENRTSRCLPILFSANVSGDELAEKFGEQYGPYIVRRLRELSRTIVIH